MRGKGGKLGAKPFIGHDGFLCGDEDAIVTAMAFHVQKKRAEGVWNTANTTDILRKLVFKLLPLNIVAMKFMLPSVCTEMIHQIRHLSLVNSGIYNGMKQMNTTIGIVCEPW